MPPLNFFYDILRDYESHRFCDLDLCGSAHNGRKITPIRCHKLVLCSLIPDWLEIVDEDTDRIDLPDVEHSQLKRLIDGLYAKLDDKRDSWEQFDPYLLAFLGIGPKLVPGSPRPEVAAARPAAETEDANAMKSEAEFEEEKSDRVREEIAHPHPVSPATQAIWTSSDEDDDDDDSNDSVWLTSRSGRKRKPTWKTADQASKNAKSTGNPPTNVPLKSRSSSCPDPRRLAALEKNRQSMESTKQTRSIDFDGLRNLLQGNNPGMLPVNVTSPNLKPFLRNLAMKSLTVHQHAFFALVGIQRRGSEILGRTLAVTTQDVETINASFNATMEAYMKVFGLSRAQLMSASCFFTHAGSIRRNKGKHFVNDLHRKFLYKCTRQDLAAELNHLDVLEGFHSSPPTHQEMALPIKNYDIGLTQELEDFEDIIIVGVYPHGVEARQMEIFDISEEFVATFCSRILTLIWGGGNDKAVFPLSRHILDLHRFNTRLNYTFKTIRKLLASNDELPRPLPIVTCEICGKQIRENVFMNNMICHKKNHMIQQFKCDCDIKFTSISHKKKHYEDCHTERKPKAAYLEFLSDDKPKAKITPQQPHICDVCGKVLTSNLTLKQHIRRAHQNITCQSCKRDFGTAMAFKKHWKDDHPGQEFEAPGNWFHCSGCEAVFSEKIDLSKHWIQSHGSDDMRPFKCGLCHKSFGEKPKLKYHVMNMHIKSRPYKCRKEGCSSTFNYCGNLYAHEKKLHGSILGKATALD
eukprot:maker-scaffold1335_size46909-snap-gene-0.14 protein:Tk00654 transcript:maker-scaffold1335_size46909-snap-gene-0.14-mRNA-1 annotation:"zinc finger protein 37-like"